MQTITRAILAGIVFALGTTAIADLPQVYDLRDVNGRQQVTTRVENQVGPGPCWSFAAVASIESNVLKQGLAFTPEPIPVGDDPTVANGLNLSEHYIRMLETQGNIDHNTGHDTPGYTRVPNSDGRTDVAVGHMSRLAGPILESQCPYEYQTTTDGYDPTPPEGTHPPQYFLKELHKISGRDKIKQAAMDYGAPYVHILHRDAAYDAATNTYYDDGNIPPGQRSGLGAHGVNIIGWDDNKATGSPHSGAWLIKQSHPTATSPTTFWVSYDSVSSGGIPTPFADVAEFFVVDKPDVVTSVYNHDLCGVGISNYGYWQNGADQSKAAMVFQADTDGANIGKISFNTAQAEEQYTLKVYDSLADLQSGVASPLATKTGTIENPGYHVIDLDAFIVLAAGDDFVISLDFALGNQFVSYSSDTYDTAENVDPGDCLFFDTETNQWADLGSYFEQWSDEDQEWQNVYYGSQSFTIKAYDMVPEPATLCLLALGGLAVLRRRKA